MVQGWNDSRVERANIGFRPHSVKRGSDKFLSPPRLASGCLKTGHWLPASATRPVHPSTRYGTTDSVMREGYRPPWCTEFLATTPVVSS